MRLAIDAMLDYAIAEPCDVLLQIEVAAMPDQRLDHQRLIVEAPEALRAVPGEDGIGQRCWTLGAGAFRAFYRAEVTIDRPTVVIEQLPATAVRDLPGHVVGYLLPSRYCEADRFDHFVRGEFPGLTGGALARALADWVQANLTYSAGATSGVTTALMTFAERRGVCRDYAHLLATLARAGGIPARCVSAYAPGVDPPDFHAVCELWLGGAWQLIDATGMAAPGDLARVVVGRDATDIAFMTVFGDAQMIAQRVSVRRV
ncbi:transglutaminase family protein [Sphingomonas koreensis]|nr:transglutaminase family protein [Sphingomonas koreensis]